MNKFVSVPAVLLTMLAAPPLFAQARVAVLHLTPFDSQIDAALESERTKDQFAFTRVLLGYALSCIVAFIFCLLISLIVKKSKPAFNNI